MTPLRMLIVGSAAVGTAAAASLTWTAVGGGRAGGQQPAGKPVAGADKVIVCMASDSVLRASTNGCAAGQTRMDLDCSDCDSEGSKGPRNSHTALADLERRLDSLRQSPLFTVVDKNDNPVFVVAPEAVLLYNEHQAAVATIRATADGGFFRVVSADGGLEASMGASETTGGVRFSQDGVPRLQLGKQEAGTFSLKLPSPNVSGGTLAGIGESRAGTGAVMVGDDTGRLKASLTVGDGKGMMGIANDSGAAVLSLTEGATQGGLLVVADHSSVPMLKMGVKDNRYGVVLAGPAGGFPLVTGSGLPGSWILGCAGGDACQP